MKGRLLAIALAIALLGGCAARNGPAADDTGPVARERFDAVRAELATAHEEIAQLRLQLAQARQRGDRASRSAERLRADIEDAEEALVSLESGLKGLHSRADAVSALADARIVVTRAAQQAPWREASIERAREKLAEAERHIEERYFGSAVFFTVRGRRIAEEVLTQAHELREDSTTRYVGVRRANVRDGPSTDTPVVTVLNRGTPVHARGKNEGWIQIVTPGNEGGWIYDDLLTTGP